MLTPFVAGITIGFSLIIAIGAQNAFVLRQGIRREHVVLVAAICAASDAILIVVGVSGIGLVLHAVPWLIDAVRWIGAAFLIAYGLLATRRAWRPSGQALSVAGEAGTVMDADPTAPRERTGGATGVAARTRVLPVVLTCLALTWLNPHVYLDTVFLLGSVANTHGEGRWIFAAGAALASVVWFFGLALGARYLARWLSTPRAWRVLDGTIAVVMIALGLSLVLPR